MTNDARIIKTNQRIKEAFLEIMKTTSFDKMTIQILCQKANINRSTFYLHYTDKFDLMNQIEEEILYGVKQIIKDIPLPILKNEGLHNDQIKIIFLRLFQYIKTNQDFFSVMISKNGDPLFLYKLQEVGKNMAINKNIGRMFKVPEHYGLALITGIHINFICEWIHSGMRESPEELIAIFSTIFEDFPMTLLNNNS